MAAAAHVSARIYGTIQGAPPFGNTSDVGPSVVNAWPQSVIMSFPTTGTIFHPVTSGFKVGNQYVYGIIEVQPTGLNVHGIKYASDTSAATLATNAG